MKAIKLIAEGILTIIACLAVVFLTAETDTIIGQIILSAGAAATIYICCKLIGKLDPNIYKEEI